jgi:hypothetical protein
VSFRAATIRDAGLLYRWRCESEQQPWWAGTRTSYGDHLRWLVGRHANPLVKLLVWEEDGEPVGTVRIDSNGEVAFDAMTGEAAGRMLEAVHEYAAGYGGRLKASVDQADRDKIRLLQAAGFEKFPVAFLAYRP